MRVPFSAFCRNKIQFNSLSARGSRVWLDVDSLLGRRAYGFLHLGPKLGSLINCQHSVDRADVTETYIPEQASNETGCDSTYVYFSTKFNNLNYSVSPLLDSLRKKKLYQFRLVYNEKISSMRNILFPKRELFFEMQPGQLNDPAVLERVFERWMKQVM